MPRLTFVEEGDWQKRKAQDEAEIEAQLASFEASIKKAADRGSRFAEETANGV